MMLHQNTLIVYRGYIVLILFPFLRFFMNILCWEYCINGSSLLSNFQSIKYYPHFYNYNSTPMNSNISYQVDTESSIVFITFFYYKLLELICVVSFVIHKSHHMYALGFGSIWYWKVSSWGYLFHYMYHWGTDKVLVSTTIVSPLPCTMHLDFVCAFINYV